MMRWVSSLLLVFSTFNVLYVRADSQTDFFLSRPISIAIKDKKFLETAQINEKILQEIGHDVLPLLDNKGSAVIRPLAGFREDLQVVVTANHVASVLLAAKKRNTGELFIDPKHSPTIIINRQNTIENNLAALEETFEAKVLFIPAGSEATAQHNVPHPSSDFVIALTENPSAKTPLNFRNISKPEVGQVVITAGYPVLGNPNSNLVVGLGKVVDPSLAKTIVEKDLISIGEQAHAFHQFNPEREFLINAIGMPGMSGGGVFNNKGELIGILDSSIFPSPVPYFNPRSATALLKKRKFQKNSYIRVILIGSPILQLDEAAKKLSRAEQHALYKLSGFQQNSTLSKKCKNLMDQILNVFKISKKT